MMRNFHIVSNFPIRKTVSSDVAISSLICLNFASDLVFVSLHLFVSDDLKIVTDKETKHLSRHYHLPTTVSATKAAKQTNTSSSHSSIYSNSFASANLYSVQNKETGLKMGTKSIYGIWIKIALLRFAKKKLPFFLHKNVNKNRLFCYTLRYNIEWSSTGATKIWNL